MPKVDYFYLYDQLILPNHLRCLDFGSINFECPKCLNFNFEVPYSYHIQGFSKIVKIHSNTEQNKVKQSIKCEHSPNKKRK